MCFGTGGLFLAHICDSRLSRLNEMCKEKISSGYATKLFFSPFLSTWTWFQTPCSFTDLLFYFLPLFQLIGTFFSENLHFCHLGEMGVVSNCCINIIYPVSSWWVLLHAIQGSSDTWFEGIDLVYCLANYNGLLQSWLNLPLVNSH